MNLIPHTVTQVPPVLKCQNLTVKYGSLTAVRNVGLTINAGEIVVLIGPSGCGKSTILRTIIGLVQPHQGTIILNDTEIAPSKSLTSRWNMGYVIQEGGLFPHLTAWENMTLPARFHKWSLDRIQSRIKTLADLLALSSDVLERYPHQVSGGQRQRISLARALFLDPEVLLLDEPLGALDPLIRSDLQTELKLLFQSMNKAVLLVTHDMNEAAYLGDRMILMKDGSVVQSGTPDDVIHNPVSSFVKSFIQAQTRQF